MNQSDSSSAWVCVFVYMLEYVRHMFMRASYVYVAPQCHTCSNSRTTEPESAVSFVFRPEFLFRFIFAGPGSATVTGSIQALIVGLH